MTLNKRYLRSIKSNLSFYVSSTVLTVMTLLMFYIMNIAGESIHEFGIRFFDEQRIEDANFTTYLPISDGDIEQLQKDYDVELEAQSFKNVETDKTTARVFERTEKIDLYDVTVGSDISKDNEVVISEGYAVNNKISVGDSIKIGKKNYTISGFFQRPDYLYMVENENDAYKNVTTFFLVYMTDREFETLGEADCQYLVRYSKDNHIEFRKHINKNFIMRSYLSAEENQRIDMVDMQAGMFVDMSYIILCIMPFIAVALISIIISRKVKSEQKMIGTLTALGYKKGKLMRHYVGFALIPGLLGGMIAVLLSVIFAQPFGELCLQDYEPMRIECSLNPYKAVLGVIVPTIMYVIAALIAVYRLLKNNTVLLLSGNADVEKKKLKRVLAGKKLSFKIKYAVRSLIGNPARTFVVFLGIFMGSFIMLLGFGCFDTMKDTIENGLDDIGTFKYQYILNELADKDTYDGEPVLAAELEEKDKKAISLIGSDSDNEYLNLKDIDGNAVDLDKGYYFTSVSVMFSGVKKGDTVELYNPLTLEKYKVKVAGIIKNDMQRAIYTNLSNASKLLGLEDGICNAVMSDKKLSIPKSKIIQTVEKADSEEQVQTMIDQMSFMVYFMIIIGAIICVASIYVAVNMLVTENKNNISMLKVLGYTDKRINNIVLSINHILLPIGILCSIPAAFAACNAFFNMMAEIIGMLMKTAIFPMSYVFTILLTGASYFGSLFLVRRKIKKVDMVESLKDNRE